KWFDEGARFVIRTQEDDGSWSGDIEPDIDTAYALLFLARGRAPVAMQKLQFTGRWNNRSRDAATVVRWLSRQTERHTNWQIVSTDSTAAELREAPILYIASDKKLELKDPEKERIKKYILQGGLLLAVNESASDPSFPSSIESLAAELFPQYRFRDLPKDHLIFNENFPTEKLQAPVKSLSNGVREMILLLPSGDFSWRWQAGAGSKDPAKAAPFGLIGNLLLYLTDKANPRYKGDDYWIDRDESARATRQMPIARVQFDGNWDPEPTGWERFSNFTHSVDGMELRISAVPMEKLRPNVDRIAHLTATAEFSFSADQQAALKRYLDGG